MKKVIVKISEGLGNQLFMFANAYAFSKRFGHELIVDNISWSFPTSKTLL